MHDLLVIGNVPPRYYQAVAEDTDSPSPDGRVHQFATGKYYCAYDVSQDGAAMKALLTLIARIGNVNPEDIGTILVDDETGDLLASCLPGAHLVNDSLILEELQKTFTSLTIFRSGNNANLNPT